MRRVSILVAVALIFGSTAYSQESQDEPPIPVQAEPRGDRRPSEDPPPPLIDEVAPADQGPARQSPAPEPSLEEEIVDRAMGYYDRAQEAPPEVAAYLAQHPGLGTTLYIIRYIQDVLIWLFLFLLIGLGGRRLLRPLFGASPADAEEPRGYARGEGTVEGESIDRRGAAAETVAWLVALAIACEAVGLTWFGALWGGLMELAAALIGAIVWLGLLIALAALIVWSFTAHGRRLVLSLLGFYYLTRSANRPPEGHVFTLPDGREGTIVSTDPLHSTMQVEDGETLAMPNADLMEQYYHWAAPDEGEAGA